MRPTLVIMLKRAVAGRVKTRLAREIGTVPAAWWFRHQSARVLRRLGPDPRWRTVIAVAPDTDARAAPWPPGVQVVPQGAGDLGARMARVLRQAPPGPVAVVGGDIPALGTPGTGPRAIARAFAVLGACDAVLGPATDGGYWLIGVKRGGRAVPAGFLEGVRWSGPQAMADSLATMRELRVGFADTLGDVDTAADLAALGLPRPG